MIEAVPRGRLVVPLMKRMEDAVIGVETEIGDELSLAPHLLFDQDGIAFVAVFTTAALVEAAATEVDLRTEGGELEYCTLPASVVLEIALEIVDGARVAGLLVNPFHDSELILKRHELASIVQRKALPLVGYVAEIPFSEDEERLIAKLDGPPPPSVLDAVEGVLRRRANPPKYGLHRTFSPERDLEPHLTLNLVTDGDPDPELAAELGAALEGKLPPPGYIDIVWNDPVLGGRAES